MKKILFVLVLVISFFGFKIEKHYQVRNFSSVTIEHEIEDSLLNVRALERFKEAAVFAFLTSKGDAGAISTGINGMSEKFLVKEIAYPIKISSDTIIPNFRSLALTSKGAFGFSIGSPARLYKMENNENVIVYEENNPKAFYDSMEMWNDMEGLAIGDPTDNCLSIIITRDGGNTWTKLNCNQLPEAIEGEAAFAASDTNIAIVGDNTWVATGGKSSRILYSPDKGKTWEVFETPIVQGKETTGMYSIDFYDDLNGFAIGGDYLDPENNSANKIVTVDGGKSWTVVGEGVDPGYRSCVQYVPKSNGKELVAVGFKGIDYSNDSGSTWKHLSDEGFYTIRFLNDSIAYAAGRGRVSKLIFRE